MAAMKKYTKNGKRQALPVFTKWLIPAAPSLKPKRLTSIPRSNRVTTSESKASDRKKVIVLGSGPNRIGQGIEFDYCCVHGLLALKECGYEAIMMNCNPETVSTDFDMADKLYFEPVFWEHLWELIEHEKPEGVIVQLGGQTALKLAERLTKKGIKIIGTSFDNMDIAEDRGRFSDMLKELKILYPNYGTAYTVDEAVEVANKVGYPVLVRPSYVLGGQTDAYRYQR